MCQNGGTTCITYPRNVRHCRCTPSYSGRCCQDRINCGHLDEIRNGRVTFTNSFYYGSIAKYSCASNYMMTSGSAQRICQWSSRWSDSKTTFSYKHCSDNPCQNAATCRDVINDYYCSCRLGWAGKNCEKDIQSPIVNNCPDDIVIHATERTVTVEWKSPTFVDPMGRHLEKSSNYARPALDFPWGDFEVLYMALKSSNGLRAHCRFKIIIGPTPCKSLNVPLNGALLCNKWATEFGQLCFMVCEEGFTIDNPGLSYTHWYVCGASGTWIPPGPLQDCSLGIPVGEDISNYQPNYTLHSFRSCDDNGSLATLRQFFIKKLKTGKFVDFCKRYPPECVAENVDVRCYNENIL